MTNTLENSQLPQKFPEISKQAKNTTIRKMLLFAISCFRRASEATGKNHRKIESFTQKLPKSSNQAKNTQNSIESQKTSICNYLFQNSIRSDWEKLWKIWKFKKSCKNVQNRLKRLKIQQNDEQGLLQLAVLRKECEAIEKHYEKFTTFTKVAKNVQNRLETHKMTKNVYCN